MKKIWNLLFIAFFISCLFLFRPREDIVFGAVSKSQYIRLFENGNDFELGVEANSTFTGTYILSRDTVYLSYHEQMNRPTANRESRLPDYPRILPKKLFINNSTSKIRSKDGESFSARIYLDVREKSQVRKSPTISELNSRPLKINTVLMDR